MKHICGENGCRWVTDEEYERIMKEQESQEQKKETKKAMPTVRNKKFSLRDYNIAGGNRKNNF